mgnify:CR=1 FL=1
MKKVSDTTHIEVHLGYFKQGCDMHCCLEQESSLPGAFRLHSLMMKDVAKHLEGVAGILDQNPELTAKTTMDADTHMIWMEAPNALAQQLIDAGLAELDPFAEEEEEWEEDEEIEEDEEDGTCCEENCGCDGNCNCEGK